MFTTIVILIYFRGSRMDFIPHTTYKARHSKFSQRIKSHHILLEPKTQTAYCYNHKSASSTWMKLLARVHNKERKFDSIVDSGKYYK